MPELENPFTEAAQLVARPDGWTQSVLQRRRNASDGLGGMAYCSVGAIHSVTYRQYGQKKGARALARTRAYEILAGVIREQYPQTPYAHNPNVNDQRLIIFWNDGLAYYAQDQVVTVFEKAAVKWEEQL